MCLIALCLRPDHETPLVLIANRDELLLRPTAPLTVWQEGADAGIVAGRDLEAGGTWMGAHPARGRIAMVTNVRAPEDLGPRREGERSRGAIVTDFLRGTGEAADFVAQAHAARDLRGFNLIAIDATGAHWASNRGGRPTRLGPGVHGVSNALLDTPWPKVVRAKDALAAALVRDEHAEDTDALLAILADEEPAPDAALPDTGVGLALERVLSPIRIRTPGYGTRCSTVMVCSRGALTIHERTVAPGPRADVRLTFG